MLNDQTTEPAGALWPDENGVPRQHGDRNPELGVSPTEFPAGLLETPQS